MARTSPNRVGIVQHPTRRQTQPLPVGTTAIEGEYAGLNRYAYVMARRAVFAMFCLASLLVALAAGLAWAVSHVRPLAWHETARDHEAGWDVWLFEPEEPFGILKHGNPAGIDRSGHWRVTWISSSSGRMSIAHHSVEYTTGPRDGRPVPVVRVQHTPDELFGPVPELASRMPRVLERTGFHCGRQSGFAWIRGKDGTGEVPLSVNIRRVDVPYWFLLLVSVPLPALWLRRTLSRARWLRRGRCPHCGYDLRASSDRCPECGQDALM